MKVVGMRAAGVAAVMTVTLAALSAQGRGTPPPPAPAPTPKSGALVDLTGYWVSLVTEDWRYRQFTPPKGDYVSIPLNPAGRKGAVRIVSLKRPKDGFTWGGKTGETVD